MIQIRPKQSAFQNKIATQIMVRTMPTELHAINSSAYIELCTENREVLFNKNIELPEAIYSQWGVEDSIIEVYILAELNLEKL